MGRAEKERSVVVWRTVWERSAQTNWEPGLAPNGSVFIFAIMADDWVVMPQKGFGRNKFKSDFTVRKDSKARFKSNDFCTQNGEIQRDIHGVS